MSAILLIVVGLLLLGATLTFVSAQYKLGYTEELGFVVLTLVLITWLIAGQNLPLFVTLSKWTELPGQRPWELSVDFTNWPLMFGYLLLTLAGQLVALAWKHSGHRPSIEYKHVTTLSLLTCAVLFTYLSTDTLEGLLISQGALIIVWILLLPSQSGGNHARIQPNWGIAGFALSLLFLWIAEAVVGDSADFLSTEMAGLSIAATMIILAGISLLGVSPFYWWRLSDRATRSQTRDSHLMQLPFLIAPAVAGASLVARLSQPVDLGTSMLVLLAAAGFIALSLGAFVAWQDLKASERVLAAVACSHIGLTILVSLWAGTAALLSIMKVHILAIGGLLIMSRTNRPRPAWYWMAPSLSLAGVPFTAGYLSQTSILSRLHEDGLLLISLILVALLSSVLVAVVMAILEGGPFVGLRRPHNSGQLFSDVAMFVILLGLVSNPLQASVESSLWVWALIAIPVMAGLVAAINRNRILNLNARLGAILQWRPTFPRTLPAALKLPANGRRAVQLAVRLLEGEGGLLWLLVLITALILIRMN